MRLSVGCGVGVGVVVGVGVGVGCGFGVSFGGVGCRPTAELSSPCLLPTGVGDFGCRAWPGKEAWLAHFHSQAAGAGNRAIFLVGGLQMYPGRPWRRRGGGLL